MLSDLKKRQVVINPFLVAIGFLCFRLCPMGRERKREKERVLDFFYMYREHNDIYTQKSLHISYMDLEKGNEEGRLVIFHQDVAWTNRKRDVSANAFVVWEDPIWRRSYVSKNSQSVVTNGRKRQWLGRGVDL